MVKKIFGKFENIPAALTLTMCFIYYFENMANRNMIVIFAVLTIATCFSPLLPILREPREKEWFSVVTSNFKYSSFLFVSGIFFTRLLVREELMQFPGSVIFFSIMIFGIIMVFSFGYFIIDYMHKSDKTIENNTKALQRSSIKGFEELLKAVEEKGGNVLVVAGNLLSLKTDKGIELLKKFLGRNSSNKVKLIIPEESQRYLKIIKQKINKANLLNQIEVLVYKPFWFLQGVVIIGRIPESEYEHAMTPVGCYYYKTRFSEEEDMAEDGIFIDLSKQDIYTDYSQAVSAYYFLMNTLSYSQSPYEVTKVFKKDSQPYNPKISVVSWDQVQQF